jgi:hypothetical protein
MSLIVMMYDLLHSSLNYLIELCVRLYCRYFVPYIEFNCVLCDKVILLIGGTELFRVCGLVMADRRL